MKHLYIIAKSIGYTLTKQGQGYVLTPRYTYPGLGKGTVYGNLTDVAEAIAKEVATQVALAENMSDHLVELYGG